MVDITPMVPRDSKIIQSYSNTGFKINNEIYKNNILVFPNKVINWDISCDGSTLDISDFSQIIGADDVEILLFGSGSKTILLKPEIKSFLKEYGIIIDVMDTGAACRTYNVLLAEERKIAAALIIAK